jgi:transposase-like protein
MNHPLGVCKIICITNPIDGVHYQIRKITKTKGTFSSEQAPLKLMYLVIEKHQQEMDDANLQ